MKQDAQTYLSSLKLALFEHDLGLASDLASKVEGVDFVDDAELYEARDLIATLIETLKSDKNATRTALENLKSAKKFLI